VRLSRRLRAAGMAALSGADDLRLSLYRSRTGGLRFKFYRLNDDIPLSDALPMMENMGLRVISDFEWEFQMNHLNRVLAPEIETVYVMASPQYSFVSSSGVKEIASFGGKVDELVPGAVARRFAELYPDGRPGAPVSPQE